MKTFFNRNPQRLHFPMPLWNVYVFLSFVLLIVLLVPLFILCIYNHPTTLDDFLVFSERKNDLPYYNILKIGLRYATFPGVFLFNFSQQPTMPEIQHMLIVYRLYSVFFILFFSITIFFALKQCNTYFLKIKSPAFFLFYSVVLFFLINSVGHFAYFFYDIILTAGYTYGICLILLFLGFLIKYHFAQNKKGYAAILFFLAFIINGTMEYYSIFLGFILFVYIISLWIKKREKKVFITAVFLLCFFTTLSYVYSPSVGNKVAAYSPGVSKPYTVQRFSSWLYDTFFYFIWNFFDYFSFKRLPFIITVSLIAAIKLNKQKYTIHAFYLVLPYFIVTVMSFSLFFAGVVHITGKISSIMIFNLILAINMLYIFTYIFQRLFVLFSRFTEKYNLTENIKKITDASIHELHTYSTKLYIIVPAVIMLYIGFIGIYNQGLPTRHAWKDVVKGTAARYNIDVLDIYNKLSQSSEKDVTLTSIENIPETLVVDNFWSVEKYTMVPQTIDMCVAPFFNKKNIRIISK